MQAIIKLAIRFRFRLPPYYTLIVRSLCSLEGIALRIDPDFSIVNAAIPIILRRMLTDTRPAAVALLRELLLDEGAQLRVGMLEGLLRNYSVEAGRGSMSATPASTE
jgi:predicted unusual protein kinase regulating ubiquinone biosynthesis (AarF/ABC1/UbiB family)